MYYARPHGPEGDHPARRARQDAQGGHLSLSLYIYIYVCIYPLQPKTLYESWSPTIDVI